MFRVLSCFLALSLAVAAQAAEVSAVDMGDGTAMILTIEGSKVVSANLVTLVKLNSIPKPPGGNPNPPAPAALTVKVKELAGKVADYPEKKAHASALAELYSSVGTQVLDGKLPTASVFPTLSAGTSLLLGTASQNWAGFRGALSDEITTLLQSGKLSTAEQFVKMLNEISAGLK